MRTAEDERYIIIMFSQNLHLGEKSCRLCFEPFLSKAQENIFMHIENHIIILCILKIILYYYVHDNNNDNNNNNNNNNNMFS